MFLSDDAVCEIATTLHCVPGMPPQSHADDHTLTCLQMLPSA